MVLTFLLIVIVNGLNQEVSKDEDYESNSFNLSEAITISGVGETTTITNSKSLIVSISGTDNIINFTKQSNPQKIIISGLRNTIYLCNKVHNPTIQKSGISNEINYLEC